jgi:hypothetical protein
LWAACGTQWRVGFGGAVGLDYLAVDRVAQIMGIRMDRLMLHKIRTLEVNQLHRNALTRQAQSGGDA